MSATLTNAALELLSAALRHVRDAEHLADADSASRSLDQACHLAGYGPECARKATLQTRVFDKALGHHLDAGIDSVLDVALALDPLAWRYEPRDWATRYPALARWSPEVRYDRTGRHAADEVGPLVAEARQVVDTVAVAVWADGLLPEGYELW